jgi:hypothetical protein
MKFKVGDIVVVSRKIVWTGASWWDVMDRTIGKQFEIIEVNRYCGYLLKTDIQEEGNYWYSVDSLENLRNEKLKRIL